jgi:predicted phage tail protein
MLITLKFHPAFYDMTGGVKEHTFDVTSLSCIREALPVLFPKMRRYIRQIIRGSVKENMCLISAEGKILTKQEYYLDRVKSEEFTLVPTIAGEGGRGFGQIILGIALIAAGVMLGGTPLGGFLIKAGISMAIGGLIQALSPTPSFNKQSSGTSADARRNNDLFDSIENTTNPNTSIPLIYGMTRVGGQMLSGHIETITHGKNDTIFVNDLFTKDLDEFTRTG